MSVPERRPAVVYPLTKFQESTEDARAVPNNAAAKVKGGLPAYADPMLAD